MHALRRSKRFLQQAKNLRERRNRTSNENRAEDKTRQFSVRELTRLHQPRALPQNQNTNQGAYNDPI